MREIHMKKQSSAWGFDPSTQQPELLRAWNRFQETGHPDPDVVSPHIAESWIRSRRHNIDPFGLPCDSLEQDEYRKRVQASAGLINLATPIIENLFESFGSSRYVVALYDSDGYHLLRLAQPEDIRLRENLGLKIGLCFDERSAGTCGFSLAKISKQMIRIAGCEHYLKLLHNLVGIYAPILEPRSRKVIGVIAVGGASLLQYPQTESIVVAARTAIENLLELDRAKRRLFIYSKSLQFAIDFQDDAIILVDRKGRVYEMNQAARKALGLYEEDVTRLHIADVKQFMPISKIITDALLLSDQETIEAECRLGNNMYLLKAQGVRKSGENIEGVLVQMKSVRDLSKICREMTVEQPRYTFEHIVGSSKAIQEVISLARFAARVDGPVVIEGESGTGKELVAQAIHNASRRKHKPFIPVNCAAIPSELIESTIFGHEKGAFTGAVRTHMGKFEMADSGTFFLDEISDMPKTMQAKMLRAIEEGKIDRVGGTRPILVDVRILSATNKDLFELVRSGLFREDLYYRLNVFRIFIPPLRERKEDIIDLIYKMVDEFSAIYEKHLFQVSKGYIDRLLDYDWPGNVRELKNAIQYSIARLEGDSLLAAHLDGFFRHEKRPESHLPEKSEAKGMARLVDLERKMIIETLRSHNDNKTEAARALGISRATLYRKLKSLH
ncbi:MAG: sigma 54-interacting transcriptional regulator [Deltaproteobacteria bacterium]|nr:sigma 54-interacting transcriptional regulator [Deltaproteobacteria bacterium]